MLEGLENNYNRLLLIGLVRDSKTVIKWFTEYEKDLTAEEKQAIQKALKEYQKRVKALSPAQNKSLAHAVLGREEMLEGVTGVVKADGIAQGSFEELLRLCAENSQIRDLMMFVVNDVAIQQAAERWYAKELENYLKQLRNPVFHRVINLWLCGEEKCAPFAEWLKQRQGTALYRQIVIFLKDFVVRIEKLFSAYNQLKPQLEKLLQDEETFLRIFPPKISESKEEKSDQATVYLLSILQEFWLNFLARVDFSCLIALNQVANEWFMQVECEKLANFFLESEISLLVKTSIERPEVIADWIKELGSAGAPATGLLAQSRQILGKPAETDFQKNFIRAMLYSDKELLIQLLANHRDLRDFLAKTKNVTSVGEQKSGKENKSEEVPLVLGESKLETKGDSKSETKERKRIARERTKPAAETAMARLSNQANLRWTAKQLGPWLYRRENAKPIAQEVKAATPIEEASTWQVENIKKLSYVKDFSKLLSQNDQALNCWLQQKADEQVAKFAEKLKSKKQQTFNVVELKLWQEIAKQWDEFNQQVAYQKILNLLLVEKKRRLFLVASAQQGILYSYPYAQFMAALAEGNVPENDAFIREFYAQFKPLKASVWQNFSCCVDMLTESQLQRNKPGQIASFTNFLFHDENRAIAIFLTKNLQEFMCAAIFWHRSGRRQLLVKQLCASLDSKTENDLFETKAEAKGDAKAYTVSTRAKQRRFSLGSPTIASADNIKNWQSLNTVFEELENGFGESASPGIVLGCGMS